MNTDDHGSKQEPTTPMRDEQQFEEGEEAAPPGVRAMAVVRWILLAAMVMAAGFSIYGYAAPLFGQEEAGEKSQPKYFCPMHPQITSDMPGECPICHMALEPMPEGKKMPPSGAPSPAPAGVDREPVPPKTPPSVGAPPPGTVPISLSLDRVQAIGVRTALVERMRTSESLRVTAAVEAPDQGKATIHARSEGFIEAIRVKEVGVKVKAGELLASIYSPAILQAQEELLAMRSWGSTLEAGPPIEAARRRLELLGVGRESIERILKGGKPIRAISISAPISGYVVRKNVVLGSAVTPEMTIFEIADLTRVYVVANVYPHQIAAIHVGDPASFTTPAAPGLTFEAKVDLIYPNVDLAMRTTRVRFQVDNKDLVLRPGQFGTAELASAAAEVLTVPLDAVVDIGRSVYVFVAEQAGQFSPRSVVLGPQVGERFVVRSGLEEGQRVVSGATYLIDAESRLQASFAGAPDAAPPPAMPGSCDAEFDRSKYPDKWAECKKCEVHRGMGTMEQDCRRAIPKPWR